MELRLIIVIVVLSVQPPLFRVQNLPNTHDKIPPRRRTRVGLTIFTVPTTFASSPATAIATAILLAIYFTGISFVAVAGRSVRLCRFVTLSPRVALMFYVGWLVYIGARSSCAFLLCTVTFYANLAHSLTRSP